MGLLSVPPSRPDRTDPAKTEETSKLVLSSDDGSGTLRDLVLGGLVEVGTGGPSAPISVHLKQILQRKNASDEEQFLASVFYRGRVGKDEPRSQQPLAVALAEIKAPLHIQISHDLEYLKSAFPRDWMLVGDPFKNRQDEAYVHFHKDLHYQLIFTNNRASDPISVTYQRFLESPEGAGEKIKTPLDPKPITHTLRPGGNIGVPGLTLGWTAFPSPEENVIRPRELVVRATVSVDGGEPLEVAPLRVRLYQIHLRDYFRFEPEVGRINDVLSWVVHGERSFQDPVTEPIPLSEISATIGGTLIEDKKGASILVNPHLKPARNTLIFHNPVTGSEPGGKIKWSAKIENERVEGEISSR